MLKSYDGKPNDVSDKDWLKKELKKELPDKTEEECSQYAEEITQSIADNTKSMKEINKYCDEGGFKEKWLANKLADACTGMSVVEYGNYLSEIDNVLKENNKNMLLTVFTKDGNINQNPNLHGFIAKQIYVNSFNRNAASQNSKLRAGILTSMRARHSKSTMDMYIGDGKEVMECSRTHFYKDAEATAKMLKKKEDYWYWKKDNIAPKGQLTDVKKHMPGSSVKDHLGGEHTDGIVSDKISKKEVLKLQQDVQKNGDIPKESWNSYRTKDLAYNLGKQAVYAGAGSALLVSGLNIAVKKINGDDIDPSETMELALTTGVDTGAKAATAGALKVAAEKGVLKIIPKGVSGFAVGTLACMAVENAKIVYKYMSGEISGAKAADMVGRVSCGTVGGALGALKGGLMAAALISNPLGAAVAGVCGMLAGSIAGNEIGEAVYEGGKKLGKKLGKCVVNDVKRRLGEGGKALESFSRGEVLEGVGHAINAILPVDLF